MTCARRSPGRRAAWPLPAGSAAGLCRRRAWIAARPCRRGDERGADLASQQRRAPVDRRGCGAGRLTARWRRDGASRRRRRLRRRRRDGGAGGGRRAAARRGRPAEVARGGGGGAGRRRRRSARARLRWRSPAPSRCRPAPPIATPTPIERNAGFSMFTRWPGEAIQAAITSRAWAGRAAMFSPERPAGGVAAIQSCAWNGSRATGGAGSSWSKYAVVAPCGAPSRRPSP